MRAGSKKVDWSPKVSGLTKTASAGAEVQEEINPLYEAAKSYIEAASVCKKCKKPGNLCSCEKSDSASSDAKSASKSDAKSASAKTAQCAEEVSAPVSDAGGSSVSVPAVDAAPASVEEAIEKVEDAVADLKEVAVEGEAESVEIDLDVEPTPDIPGKEVSDSEIIVKSEPDMACACAKKKEVAMDKSASTEEEFCKFAMLSKANRAKLNDYWINMLGFPKDYVNLMTKDYEK